MRCTISSRRWFKAPTAARKEMTPVPRQPTKNSCTPTRMKDSALVGIAILFNHRLIIIMPPFITFIKLDACRVQPALHIHLILPSNVEPGTQPNGDTNNKNPCQQGNKSVEQSFTATRDRHAGQTPENHQVFKLAFTNWGEERVCKASLRAGPLYSMVRTGCCTVTATM